MASGDASQKIDHVFKVVLIGDSAVGKSQIVARFARNEFSLDSKATIAFEFKTRTLIIQHQSVKAQIWYTAGQERCGRRYTRSGQKMKRNATLIDTSRVKYLKAFIGSLLDAMRNGSNARGYFYWSFMDLFELLAGYDTSYGLYYVDLNDKDLKRYPKLSAHWYSNFLKGKSSSSNGAIEVEKTTLSLLQSHSSQ